MRFAAAALVVLVGCKSEPPSCHERVLAMAAHLAAPRSFAELDVQVAAPGQIAARLVTAVGGCRPAADAFAGMANLDPGVDKRAYLRGKVPDAIEACRCTASPEVVGPLIEQLFGAWNVPEPR